MADEPIAEPGAEEVVIDAEPEGSEVFADTPAPVATLPPATGAEPAATGAEPAVTGAEPAVTGAEPAATGAPPAEIPPATGAPPAEAPRTYSVEEIATLRTALTPAPTKAGEPPAKEMTDEEFNKAMNVFATTQEHIDAIHEGGEGAVNAMNAIVNGAVKEAVTFAKVLANQELNAYKQQLAPYVEMAQSQMFANEVTAFYAQNGHLKGHEEVVDMAYKNLVGAGTKFKSDKEAFTAIAAEADKLIKTIRGGETPPPKTPTGQPPKLPTNKMPPLAGAGQGGGSNEPEAVAASGPPGSHVFE